LAVAILVIMTTIMTTGRWSPVLFAQQSPFAIALALQDDPVTVQPGTIITQQLQLSYVGETTIDAVFVQEIPSGVRPIAPPIVSTLQPESVTPLTIERRGRTWGWRGKMKPEAILTVVVVLRVQQCYGDDQLLTFAVNARRLPNGAAHTDRAQVTVDCPEQSIADIHMEETIIYPDGSESERSGNDLRVASVGAMNTSHAIAAIGRFYLPGIQLKLRITLRNDGTDLVTIGTAGAATCCPCLTCTVTANIHRELLPITVDPTFRRFVLRPGETHAFEQEMSGTPAVNGPGDEGEYRYGGEITYCLLTEEDTTCPDPVANPRLAANHLINIPVRSSDLGDAPDSTNHSAGAAAIMPAYAGVQANFPTVFDPTTGAEQGPIHRYPQFLHLGQRVSREAEADSGPDQDPQNNLLPSTDSPNNDRGDDGTELASWALQHCQSTQLPVQIYISPAAVTWFQQKGEKAYLNSWLDFTRDGDWADVVSCQDSDNQSRRAVEHIVVDYAVDVVTLGVGLHTITVPTGIVHWPVDAIQQPAWARLTLSERVANKTVTADTLSYGDGRGYSSAFRTGETEDYLYLDPAAAGGGPDLEVQLDGVVEEREVGHEVFPTQEDSVVAKVDINFDVRFRIDYSNRGDSTANGALLEFQIPEKLWGSQPSFLRAPGIATANIKFDTNKISFGLPALKMGGIGTIIVGWTGCLTCTLAANIRVTDLATPTADFDAAVNVSLADDLNTENNVATIRPRNVLIGAGIGGFYTANASAWRRHGVTCQDTVTFAGRGRPGATVQWQIESLSAHSDMGDSLHRVASSNLWQEPLTGTVQVGVNGIWQFTQSGLPDGSYRVGAAYPSQPLNRAARSNQLLDRDYLTPMIDITIDPSLAVDPMSFRLEDAQGRSYYPPVASRLGNFDIQDFLVREAGDYTVSAIACPNQIIEQLQFQVGDRLVDAAPAADDCEPKGSDACGPWHAKINIPGTLQTFAAGTDSRDVNSGSNAFEIIATTAAMDNRFAGSLRTDSPAAISDRVGTPIVDATVTLLAAVTTSSTDGDGQTRTSSFFVPWNGTDYGQNNPLTTADDGTYSFAAPAGIYRVRVDHSGYQSYVTSAIEHIDGALIAEEITLPPEIGEEADYIIEVNEGGFLPATLTVRPGSIVAFVNVDFADHATRGVEWDSGILVPGAIHKVHLDSIGTYLYSDTVNSSNAGAIIVDDRMPIAENQLFLPVIVR